ncbi:hypothetical protein RUM43_013312 [Polyplax serrata]|uniref:DUF676 domain-containing protein n=1 Tax=Polyplax serrata TaxID=468196 RepID=A0AAN8PHP9_POLSC
MSELQATVEFSIELHKFYNVDLFQRGFYQVRTSLKVSPKLSVKIEVNLSRNQKTDHVFSPFVTNGCGVSRIFQILYRNQEVLLDNVILFRVHLLVDSYKIEETLERANFTLNVELWFTEQPYLLSQQNGTSCVSVRTLHLHFSPIKGLHYHLPVLFDYFHLAAVTVTIHAILVALHQPYINTPRSGKTFFGSPYYLNSNQSNSVDSLFFGTMNSTKCASTGTRLAHARHIHQEVCSILLATYDTLQSHLQDYMKLLPTWQQLKLETNDCMKRLINLNDTAKVCVIQSIDAEDDFISVANSDIAQLCAENILLWHQFLDAFTSKIPILQHLAKYHHQLRVKRFSEAFFVVDNPRQSAAGCYDANYQNYMTVSETVRRSRYLASLPSLPVSCTELDGDITTMPIIFEDQYKDVGQFAMRRHNEGSKKSGSDPFLNVIGETIQLRSVKEEECSCGIVAILESRAQKNSSRPVSDSQQSFNSLKVNTKLSLGVLKMEESTISDENVVRATLTIGSSEANSEIMTNISTLLLKYKESSKSKNEMILAETQSKTLPVRQRHSKSLDHLKDTGIQRPATSNCITRSTSSHMSYNVSSIKQRRPNNDYLKKHGKSGKMNCRSSGGSGSAVEVTSSSTDSGDSMNGRKLETSVSAPYGLCGNPIHRNGNLRSTSKMKYSASTLSMPNTTSENLKESSKLLLGNSSESMPNLIQTPCDSPKNSGTIHLRSNHKKTFENKDILALYEINDSTIVEEVGDDHLDTKSTKPDPSSPPSSLSDELTSEQSGWVSNSSRHSSVTQSSSGALSPENAIFDRQHLPVYPTLVTKKMGQHTVESVFDEDILVEKLEKLAVKSAQSGESAYDDVRLPPPHQFRDVPSPPEHFRDPPTTSATSRPGKTNKSSVDNLLYHFYDFDVDKRSEKSKMRELRTSFENLALDFFKEVKHRDRSHGKRSKKKAREKKQKPTSDIDFRELKTKQNDSDTNTLDAWYHNGKMEKLKMETKLKNPFQGYLFKEDIETLRKSIEKDRNEKGPFKDSASSKNMRENGDATMNNKVRSTFDDGHNDEKSKLKSIEDEALTFVKAKEEFKRQMNFTGMIYSDFPTPASTLPYFHISDEYRIFSPEGLHLIVCVHGLDGNSNDLRLIKTYVELGLPGANLEFLMSERNQGDTFSDFETMTDKLVAEILYHIETCGPTPSKISFIGHSLGNIIIRSAITRPQLKYLLPRFHTFLSLSGPHLGTLYNNSGLVNMGMWFMQKWKKSGSLLQLSLKDAPDVRQSFLYRLSQKSNLHHFRHVLLCGSSQDRYVPMHSARIELCKAAVKDTSIQGVVYREMVNNIIHPVINSSDTTLVRYDIHHALPNTANSLIGRAAHIAVLDSELFIEKFLVVTGLKYFR